MNLKLEAKAELERRARAILASRHVFNFIKYTFRAYRRENWHHRLISDYLQKAAERKIQRLMIFAPPRHMKTESQQRAAAWALGNDNDCKIMICGYGSPKADKISKHIKSIVKDPIFSQVFQQFKKWNWAGASDTVSFWELGNGTRGSVLAAGVGGSIIGEGFNLGFIDDPVKDREQAESPTYQEKTFEWYEGTFLNRQDEFDSSIVITNTRWNRKDLAGKILERDGIASFNGQEPSEGCPEWNGQEGGIWHILSLPAVMDDIAYPWKHPEDPREIGEALWPDRFPIEHLAQFMKNKYDWESLFQQRPKPKGGNMISRSWFKIVEDIPKLEKIVRFWDMAGTPKAEGRKNDPDFTAGALIGLCQGKLYILDVKVTRDTPMVVERLITETAEHDESFWRNVQVMWEEEPGSSGKHVTEYYKRILSKYNRKPYKTSKKKEWYIDLLANKAQTGDVYALNGPWLHEVHDGNTFFDEAEEFPKGRHDDRIDAAAKAAHMLTEGQKSVLDLFGDDVRL